MTKQEESGLRLALMYGVNYPPLDEAVDHTEWLLGELYDAGALVQCSECMRLWPRDHEFVIPVGDDKGGHLATDPHVCRGGEGCSDVWE